MEELGVVEDGPVGGHQSPVALEGPELFGHQHEFAGEADFVAGPDADDVDEELAVGDGRQWAGQDRVDDDGDVGGGVGSWSSMRLPAWTSPWKKPRSRAASSQARTEARSAPSRSSPV